VVVKERAFLDRSRAVIYLDSATVTGGISVLKQETINQAATCRIDTSGSPISVNGRNIRLPIPLAEECFRSVETAIQRNTVRESDVFGVPPLFDPDLVAGAGGGDR
jgi:hypothetical protein